MMLKPKSSSVWNMSSSDDDDDESSILSPNITFLSPTKHKSAASGATSRDGSHLKLENDKKQPICPYGKDCYRKNPLHLREYQHPKRNQIDSVLNQIPAKRMKVVEETSCPSAGGKSNSRPDPRVVWELSAPHYFLLTTVRGIPKRYNHCLRPPDNNNHQLAPHSLGIRDILSPAFGELLESAQFNYCIDVGWMMEQYPESARARPLLLVHGEQRHRETKLRAECEAYPNIKLCRADLPPYGTHHSKMMLLRYRDGIRVVITTANLVAGDWAQKTQGLWISPLFPPGSGEDLTGFKRDLVEYLRAYDRKQLQPWMNAIADHDTSAANVVLIGSVPGSHQRQADAHERWGHGKLRRTLRTHAHRTDTSWPILAQFSSIGSLGKDESAWLCAEFASSLAACKNQPISRVPSVKLIFPSVEDVRCSLEGYPAGASLPYGAATAAKQPWLRSHMQRWQASHCGRTEASPHIKSYCRLSPFSTNVRTPWFLLTSANLSKAAWGVWGKSGAQLMIRSFELGVLFLPKFSRRASSPEKAGGYFHVFEHADENCFPLPFSLPLKAYDADNEPWTWDSPHRDAPDRYGNMWVPS